MPRTWTQSTSPDVVEFHHVDLIRIMEHFDWLLGNVKGHA